MLNEFKEKNKTKRDGDCEEKSFLLKCVAILTACSSKFLFTELYFHTKITTYPTPKLQV
jgi:hypothetical protein